MSVSISFFSNFFNRHQLPIALELASCPGVRYSFVAMQRMDGLEGRQCLNDDYPFVVRNYLGGPEADAALMHAREDDIVVFGDMAGDESYVRERAKAGKIFFRYAERLLKRGDWWALLPPKQYRTYNRFTRYNNANMYVLCSSGYTSRDLLKFGYPVEKCLKWGYFPQVDFAPVKSREKFASHSVALCSAQRLISWKRVDLQIRLVEELDKLGIPFTFDIAGDGIELERLQELSCKLGVGDRVHFLGGLTSEETLALMSNSDIFLATSNRMEGWGATLNEAMASGCAVVASNQIGAAPFLIKNNLDGLIFHSGDVKDLARAVSELVVNQEKLHSIAYAAMNKIRGIWSARCAAERLIEVSNRYLTDGKIIPFDDDGPLSAAKVIEEDWYLR